MYAAVLDSVELPVEIMEHVFLHLSGLDGSGAGVVVDFLLHDPGQPTLPGSHPRSPSSTDAGSLPLVRSTIPSILAIWLNVESYVKGMHTSGPIQRPL